MQINTELDTHHYDKLQQLQITTGKNISTLLELAIDDLYARNNVATGNEALKILKENNFVGCLHSDTSLSQNYKQDLDWSDKL